MKNGSQKRILITGATGFIGSYFLEHVLKNSDHECICIQGLTYASKANEVVTLTAPYSHRIKWLYHNLTAPLTPDVLERIGKVDYVVNFASESHVDRSIQNPVEFVSNNVAITLNLIDACRTFIKPKKIIHFSTDEVFGPTDGKSLHREFDVHKPSNPYSASKSAQESILYAYWRTYNLPIVITNSMNIFGSRQNKEKFIPRVVRAILKGDPVTVHSKIENGDVEPSSRCWISAETISDAIFHVMTFAEPNKVTALSSIQRFNIAGPKITCSKIVEMAAECLNKVSTKIEYVDFHSSYRGAGHDLHYGLDDTKIREFGYIYKTTFEEDFKNTVTNLAERFQNE